VRDQSSDDLVARIERSEIREFSSYREVHPGFAALNPGYRALF
jgi:hypothetical protein